MPTMKDVARAAGVSQAAVSYAYSRPSKISAAQVEHILETAASLGYAGPSSIGASLRSGKTGAVGLMVTDTLAFAFADPSTRLLLESIVRSASLDGLNLTLVPLPRSDDSRSGLRGLVDGLIVHALPDDHPGLLTLQARGIPVVVVDAPLLPGVPSVGIADREAGRAQVEHLLALGHRRIGIITDRLRPDGHHGKVTPERLAGSAERVVRERLSGYTDAFAAAALSIGDAPIFEAGGFDDATGRAAVGQLLDAYDVTAIACVSDSMAIAALDELAERGLDVPGAVSVIGFDDAPIAATYGLTTIRQPLTEKGTLAADMLGRLMAGESNVASVRLPTALVVRSTTGPPDDIVRPT